MPEDSGTILADEKVCVVPSVSDGTINCALPLQQVLDLRDGHLDSA